MCPPGRQHSGPRGKRAAEGSRKPQAPRGPGAHDACRVGCRTPPAQPGPRLPRYRGGEANERDRPSAAARRPGRERASASGRRRGSGTPAEPPEGRSAPRRQRIELDGCGRPRGPLPFSARYPAGVAGADAGGAFPAAILRRAPPAGRVPGSVASSFQYPSGCRSREAAVSPPLSCGVGCRSRPRFPPPLSCGGAGPPGVVFIHKAMAVDRVLVRRGSGVIPIGDHYRRVCDAVVVVVQTGVDLAA